MNTNADRSGPPGAGKPKLELGPDGLPTRLVGSIPSQSRRVPLQHASTNPTQPQIPSRGVRDYASVTFWDGVAALLAKWIPEHIVETFARPDYLDVAVTPLLTSVLLEDLNEALWKVVDLASACRQQNELARAVGPHAFSICDLFSNKLYLCVADNLLTFAFENPVEPKEFLISLIAAKIETLKNLDEGELTRLYSLLSDAERRAPGPSDRPEEVDADEANYLSRPKGETAPAFVRRVYGRWIGELSRDQLKKINPAAYRGLYAYEAAHGRITQERDGFTLMTRSERIDKELQRAGSLQPNQDERKRRRLREAAARRAPKPK